LVKDLRYFIDVLERKNPENVVRVKREVDPRFELSGVLRKLQDQNKFPAVMFSHVKGSEISVISNVIGKPENIPLALETTEDKALEAYSKAVDHPIEPKIVNTGPIRDVVMTGSDVDLTKLPVITNCEKDDGPYITAGITLVKDPDTGVRDTGIFKGAIRGKNKVILPMEEHARANYDFRKAEAAGKPLEAVVFIGHHPAVALGSQAKVPYTVDDLAVMSGLLREPLELVKCETVDLEVPAYAEIALEGRILPKVREYHGAFGDFAKYYAHPPSPSSVFEVTAITHRKDAIYQHIFAAHPEHNLHGKLARETVLYQRVKAIVPMVQKVSLPMSGLCRFTAYVSIRKDYDGAGKLAALGALASDPFIKLAIIVDQDVNVSNETEVLWAIATRTHANEAIFVVPDAAVSGIDPSAYTVRSRVEKGRLNAKWAIDATKPVEAPFAEFSDVPRQVWERIDLKDYVEGWK